MIKVSTANKYSPILVGITSKNILKNLYFSHKHEIKREKCPTLGKTCTTCLKSNHFQAVCKSKKKNVERIEENKTDMEVKNKNKNVKKLNKRKKTLYERLKSITLIWIYKWILAVS